MILALVGFFWLEPHLRRSFIEILETRLGAEVKVESLFFSPMGRVVGGGMVIEGERGGKDYSIRFENFDFSSRENIYITLWEEQGEFDWLNLSYDIKISGIEWQSVEESLVRSTMTEVSGFWGASGWKLEGHHLMASGNWGQGQMKNWECSSDSRGLEVEMIKGKGEGPWGNIGLSSLKLGWHDGEGSVPIWAKSWGPEEVLSATEEFRLSGLVFKGRDQSLILQQGRFQRMREKVWEVKASGKWNEKDWNGSFSVEREEKDFWAIRGELPVTYLNEILSLEVSGPLNTRGPWKSKFQGPGKNLMELFTSRGEDDFWLGTYKVQLQDWKPENSDWEPLSGKLQGGFSWESSASLVRFKGAVDELFGGPARTRDGKGVFDGEYLINKKYLLLKSLKLAEGSEWSGNLRAGLQISPLQPETLEVELSDFPLGRYSPKASGRLDVKGALSEGELSVTVSSPKLFPNKDPLQFMEDFKVEVDCDDRGVHYRQTFLQDSQSRLIEVKVAVESFLDDPMKMREGSLKTLKARAGLFDLNLVSEAPVRISLEGAQAPSFQLVDGNGRLKELRGHAFIPFLNPSKLLIEAEGKMDLGKMPQIGETRIAGVIDILDARWDKGWSLINLEARLRGNQIEVKPESIFDEMLVKKVEGSLKNSTVIIDDLLAETKESGVLKGNGRYNFREPHIDFSLKAEQLSFRSSDYQLIYDLEEMKVKGPPLGLKISGNLLVREFLYSGDFSMMGEKNGERPSLPLQSAASRLVGHHLDLSVRSEKALEIKNNSLDLTFAIDDLLIHGPVKELKWKGVANSTERDENRISLPLQWLDVSFKANKLSLVLDDQETWNPRVHLQAETEIEDVKVYLAYDDRLDALSKGDFNLSSSPAYSKQEILSMLSSGSKPDREIFDEGGSTPVTEEAGPSLTLFKSRPRSNRSQALTYSASLRSDSGEKEFFELRVYYRLSEHLDLELSQDGEEGAFAGLRYSKQAESFKALVKRDDLLERPKKNEGLPIRWDFEGLPVGSGLSSRLRESLARVEGLLDTHQLDQARLIMKETINDVLAKEGFLDARYTIQAYERRVRTLPGRGRDFARRFEFGRVKISFSCGTSYRLESVELDGWPTLIPLPEDPWLKARHMRRPVIQSERLDEFQSALLNTLSDRGYALAEVVSLRIEPVPEEKGTPLLEGLTPFSVTSESREEERWREEVPVILKIEVSAGTRQFMVQHFIEGLESISHEKAMEIIGADDGEYFRENRILEYPQKLLAWYRGEGYFDTQVEVRRILRSKRYPRLSLHMYVKEGKRWTIGQVRVEGLKKSEASFLIEVGKLKSGEQANPVALEMSLRRIGKLPHIRSLSHRWGELKEGRRDLIFEVEEHPRWRFSTRLGYESGDGEQMSFRLQKSNLFGRGEEGALESDFSPEEQRHLLRYQRHSPWLEEWSEQFTMGFRETEISLQNLENQTWIASLSLLDSDEMNTRSWGLSYREDRNLQGEAPSMRVSWVNDRFSVTAPRRPGRGLSYRLHQQGVAYLDRNRFAVIGEGRLSYGFKFGGSTMVPWVRAGQAWPIGSKAALPLADRFFLGGAGSLRGFERDEITGRNLQGGESMLSYGSELFYPVLDWMDGSLFYEWGRVFDGYRYDLGGLRGHAIGMGLVFRTPVGPIEGFFAHPLGVKRSGRLGFQLGTIF